MLVVSTLSSYDMTFSQKEFTLCCCTLTFRILHFEVYDILKCKNFLISFPDELGNFKQKIFTFHNVRFFTFYSNGHLGLATHYISKSWLILNFLRYSVFIEVGYLFILCYIWKNSIFISYRSTKVAFSHFLSEKIHGNFVSRGNFMNFGWMKFEKISKFSTIHSQKIGVCILEFLQTQLLCFSFFFNRLK